MSLRPAVTIVGGGIAGLVAARVLAPSHDVTVLEASEEVGGKLATVTFRGRPLDRGPDAFITRNPAAADLCRALGLGDELIAPAVSSAAIWSRGRLRPFPAGLAIGIPTDIAALRRSGIISLAGLARATLDAVLPGRLPTSLVEDAHSGRADPTVAQVIGRRLGRATLGALVDPLIGGINASDVDALSFVAALPQLAPLVAGKRRIAPALRPAPRPTVGSAPLAVFYGLERGLGSLPDALERALVDAGVTIGRGVAVRQVERIGARRWRVTVGDHTIEADAVILTTPAMVSARLIEHADPQLADALDAIPYAGVVTVTIAWPEGAVPPRTAASLQAITRRPGTGAEGSARILPGSGVLVPRGQGHLITGATFTSTKWPRSANPGEVVVRASAGRHHDERALELDDRELVDAVRRDLSSILGVAGAPLECRIERWPESFPQYVTGHLALIGRIRRACEALGTIAVGGAAYDGIGIPACVESGTGAAEEIVRRLAR